MTMWSPLEQKFVGDQLETMTRKLKRSNNTDMTSLSNSFEGEDFQPTTLNTQKEP